MDSLLEDAKEKVREIFGPPVADQLDSFENPKKYPEEFMDECVDFIGKLIGYEASRKKFEPLMKKYGITLKREHGVAGSGAPEWGVAAKPTGHSRHFGSFSF